MATIEAAVAIGIDRAKAEELLTYGQSVLNAAVKERSKQDVDYLAKFKERYADEYAAAEFALSALRKHIAEFTTENPKARLEFDSEQLVKSGKRAKKSRGSTGKTREKVELSTITQSYAGCKLSYNGNDAELLSDGKVKMGDTAHNTPNAWMQAVKTAGARAGIWYNVIKIDIGEGAPVSMAKAYGKAKNTALPPSSN